MSVRAVSEARTVCEAYTVKRENSSNTVYRKKKVSFSDIINVKILYPDNILVADDVDKSDTLSDVPIIARDIKKTPSKVENTSDMVHYSNISTNHENAEIFAHNLVDVILQRAKSFQTNTVYLP
jgi:hypothetical protein